MNHTRPFIVQREIQIKPGDPLSQIDMLNTQKRLYDLGIFSQVDTAVQNPESNEREKNVLVNVQEAKRYTFNYGLGLEFQTGQPSSEHQPATGRDRGQPASFVRRDPAQFPRPESHGDAQGQRRRPAAAGPDQLRSSALVQQSQLAAYLTAFYDNTVDVTTFTSQRLEGSVQAEQTINKTSLMTYRLTYPAGAGE